MKFFYEYRTSDNAKHSGVVNAANRDAAFSCLKSKGVRPSRLEEAPGFFNKLFGRCKRWIAIGVLAVGCVVLALHAFLWSDGAVSERRSDVDSVIESKMRRQLIGDSAVIEKGIRTGWADVFEKEGERFLASFAIPGVPAGMRTTSSDEVKFALSRQVQAKDGDGIEARQIKAMVEGMKDELRSFISNGGSIVEYGRRLVERQEKEIGYYNLTKKELETAAETGMSSDKLEALWEDRNSRLRKMGIRLVSIPE